MDATNLRQVSGFAKALDPAYASGFGDLPVHEFATDPDDASLAYLSYYAGGFRAIQIQCRNPKDTSTRKLAQVGGYTDPRGNNFWGAEVWKHPATGTKYVLGSDRDSGLWIFRYTP